MRQRFSSYQINYYALLAFFIIAIVQGISLKALYADGSTLLLDIFTQRHILRWDYSRQMAHIITQLPTIAIIWMGIKNLYFLTFVYGFTLAMQPLITFYICFRLLRESYGDLIPWFLGIILLLQINAGLYISSESLTGAYIFCILIALILTTRETINFYQSILLFVISLCLPRLFEGYIVFSPLIIAMMCGNKPNLFQKPFYLQKLLYLFCIATNVIAFIIALYSILYTTRNSMHIHISTAHTNTLQLPYVLSGVLLLICMAILVQWIYHQHSNQQLIMLLVCMSTGLLIGLHPLFSISYRPQEYNHGTRSIAILLPLILLFAAFYHHRILSVLPHRLLQYMRNRIPNAQIILLSIFVWNISWQLTTSYQWKSYIHQVHGAIHMKQGPIALESTDLLQHTFTKSWSTPSLGLLIAAILDRKISSILIPPPGIWQPFQATDYNQWPDLRYYGITYAPIWYEQNP